MLEVDTCRTMYTDLYNTAVFFQCLCVIARQPRKPHGGPHQNQDELPTQILAMNLKGQSNHISRLKPFVCIHVQLLDLL